MISTIKGNKITLYNAATTTHNINYPEVEVTVDADWAGLSLVALFRQGLVSKSVNIVDNKCTIPLDCLETTDSLLKIGVYGEAFDVTGKLIKRLTTNFAVIPLTYGTLPELGTDIAVPEISIWEQYFSAISLMHDEVITAYEPLMNAAAQVAQDTQTVTEKAALVATNTETVVQKAAEVEQRAAQAEEWINSVFYIVAPPVSAIEDATILNLGSPLDL